MRWGSEKRIKAIMMQMESERSKARNIWQKEWERFSSAVRRIDKVTQLPAVGRIQRLLVFIKMKFSV